MGFAVRVRSAGQKYGPTCHQRDRADVTEFVTLVRLSSLGQHVGVLALAVYKRRKSALTAGTIGIKDSCLSVNSPSSSWSSTGHTPNFAEPCVPLNLSRDKPLEEVSSVLTVGHQGHWLLRQGCQLITAFVNQLQTY